MKSPHNQYIYGWLERIEANIAKFKQLPEETQASPAEQLEFISHQYHLVMLIHRALDGQVIFVGARPVAGT